MNKGQIRLLLSGFNVFKWTRFLKRSLMYERSSRNSNALSTLRHLYEIIRLYRKNKLSYDEYYFYEFHKEIYTWQEKVRFLSGKQRGELTRRYNHPAYNIITDDKLVFKRYFAGAGFPLSELVGVFDPIKGFLEGGGDLRTKEDIRNWMRTGGCEDPVFKPIRGLRGQGVLVFKGRDPRDRDVLIHVNGEKYDADCLYDYLTQKNNYKSASFLIEKRIHQHPLLNNLNPHTTHTIRIVTLRFPDGNVEIIGMVFRLGEGDRGIDNIHAGNIRVGIQDVQNGVLGHGIVEVNGEREYISVHPRTKVEFLGLKLPYFEETKDLAIRAAGALLNTCSMGWDIAVGEDGPILIEGNEAWGEGMQVGSKKGVLTPRISELIA